MAYQTKQRPSRDDFDHSEVDFEEPESVEDEEDVPAGQQRNPRR